MGFRTQLAITFFLVAKVAFNCASAQAAFSSAKSFSSGNAQGSNFAGSEGYSNAQGSGNNQNFNNDQYLNNGQYFNDDPYFNSGPNYNNDQNYNGDKNFAYSQSSATAQSGSNQAGPANNWNNNGGTAPSNGNNLAWASSDTAPSQSNDASADAAAVSSSNGPPNGAPNNGPDSDWTWDANQSPSRVPNDGGWDTKKGLVPGNVLLGWGFFSDVLKKTSFTAIDLLRQKWKELIFKYIKCLSSPESMQRIQTSSGCMKDAGLNKDNWANCMMNHWGAVKASDLTLSSWECWLITFVELSKAFVLALKTGNFSCVFTAVDPLMNSWMADAVGRMDPYVKMVMGGGK